MTAITADPVRFAVGTLTRLPVPPPTRVDPDVAGRGLALGPLVGAAIGLVSGALLLLPGAAPSAGSDPVARLFWATLVVALAAWLTRGLHWDGLADLADGLGSGAPPQRAREIMRRSDIGPFGVLTLVLTLASQVLCLAMLPAGTPALAGWVLAVTMGRFALAAACGPYWDPARTDGLGAQVIGSVTPARLATAGGFAAAVAGAAWELGPLPILGALVWSPLAAIVVSVALSRVARLRLGGSTGDVLGAIVELATAVALLALALALG